MTTTGNSPVGQSERRLATIREHVEIAHREIQAAQKLAYESSHGVGDLAPLRVRLALNRAQSTLIKLLVHRLPEPPQRAAGESELLPRKWLRTPPEWWR
jgi:hypothetical protein